jgi:ABC-type Fe3+-hydroxamate transport system substrate-binding protein
MPFPLATSDALGRPVALPAPPRRIVSLVPSQTELLADLQLDHEVVGITKFCVLPEEWHAQKPYVGGTKDVHVERVRALRPDLVLANREENVREQVEALATFAPVYVTDVRTVEGACAMIRAVGRLVDRADTGTADWAAVIAEGIASYFAGLPAFAPLRAAYLIWREPWMSVGGDTFIHDVMARAGLANVFGARTRYPVVTPDDLRAARPDVVLLSSEPYPFKPKHAVEVRAVLPEARVERVDGQAFSWYGSRLRHTPPYLAALRAELG